MTDDRSIDTPAGGIRTGDVLTYELCGGEARTCRVTKVYDDIKNGEPGFDAIELDLYGVERDNDWNHGRVWGYADQVVTIDRREPS